MTMITPSYLGETIEYSSLHACRSTLEDPTSPRQALLLTRFSNGRLHARSKSSISLTFLGIQERPPSVASPEVGENDHTCNGRVRTP